MKKIKLKDICNISTGGTPSRSNINYWNNGDIPWCKIGDFSGKYINQVKENITEEGLKNSSAKIFKRGTILYTIFATIGEVAILEIESATNQAIAGLELINNEVDLEYLYYYLKSLKFVMLKKSRGVAQNNINLGILKNIEIKIPDKGEQINIAKILANIEKVIDKKNKQLKELNTIIKSQFVEMFGEPLISNKYGRITLDKLIKVSQGLQIPIEKRKNDKGRNRYKYITIQYLNGSKKEEYIENPNERVICNKEDILMTRTGNTGQVITNVEGVFHNNFFKMDYDRKIINKEFLIKYFENELIYKDIIRRATTSTIPDLSHSQFYKMSIDLPPLELQNQFSEIVKQIDKQKFESMIQLEKENNDSINNIIKGTLEETTILYEVLLKKCFEKGK